MIIKFTHGITKESETWEVFGDIDHYSFCMHSANEMKDILKHRLDFTDGQNLNNVWDISLFRKDTPGIMEIAAHSPIFILNDEGRTVDKI